MNNKEKQLNRKRNWDILQIQKQSDPKRRKIEGSPQEQVNDESNVDSEVKEHVVSPVPALERMRARQREEEPPIEKFELLPKDAPYEKLTHNIDDTFESIPVDDTIKKAIADMGFKTMMPIQKQVVPDALLGRDILASAQTGSGKTLAFLIPALELIVKAQFKPRNGTGVIVISPTRELALQTYGVVSELLKYQKDSKTFVLLVGGSSKLPEEKKLMRGANIVIATPGRLLDHLSNTKGFYIANLRCLIIDEADRLLEIGFEEEIKSIVRKLPVERQTMMFSATQTRNVEDLAKLSLKKKPVEIHVDINRAVATVEGLEQGYIVCDSDVRFLLLFTFLKKNIKKKIIVFFSSCAAVQFYSELLNYIDIGVLSLHGQQKQLKRSKTFFEFKNAQRGILICTDVAARGLDIPAVDWIVQYDPPDDPKEYIHRVGRTARGVNGKGHALLFLLPTELLFLKFLREMKVPLEEFEFPKNKIINIQAQLIKLVETIYYLHQSAVDGYKGYLRSYASHTHREIFDVGHLDLQKVGKSFGLPAPPHVDLRGANLQKIEPSARYTKGNNVKRGSFGKFSADNPHGKRAAGDNRQFSKS